MSKFGYKGPTVDHSLLSPSGRMSKRARRAAEARETAKLFPPGFWDKPALTAKEQASAKRESMVRHVKTLRDLAARGMSQRRFTREADRLEQDIEELGGAEDL